MQRFSKIEDAILTFAQRIFVAVTCPTEAQRRAMLLICGAFLLVGGFCGEALAHVTPSPPIQYHDRRREAFLLALIDAGEDIFAYMEGSFGALTMLSAGFGCIVAVLLRRYRLALFLAGLAVGAFVIRSYISSFFNDEGVIT